MLAIDIGNENLAELVTRHKVHNLFHTAGIELVENIIEQQQWHLATLAMEEMELSQFKSHKKTLVLPLRALLFNSITAKLHHKVVAMAPLCGVPHAAVIGTRCTQQGRQIALVHMAAESKAHTLLATRYGIVKLGEDRHKLVYKSHTPVIYIHRLGNHHILNKREHLGIGLALATQQHIALRKGAVVTYERIKILLVVLRNNHIHKAAALLAATCNKFVVGRGYHHKRQGANVVGQAVVTLFIAFELLFLATFKTARDLLVNAAVAAICPLQHKERGIVQDIGAITHRNGALAKG